MKSFIFFRNCIFRIAALAIVVFLFNSQAGAQLSGIYTVNPDGGNFASGNFKSVSEAVDSLNSQGVGGQVTINIADGTYFGRYSLNHTETTSEIFNVVFQSASGDSMAVILIDNFYNDDNINHIVRFEGLDYVTFRGITFNATSGPYDFTGTAIYFNHPYFHDVKFESCRFLGKPDVTSYERNSLVVCDNYYHDDIVFEKCHFISGEKGIYMSAPNTSNKSNGMEIRDCIFDNQAEHPIYLQYYISPVIDGNIITVTKDAKRGIYVQESAWEIQVTNNQIYLNNPSNAIYLNGCDGASGLEGLVANNSVSVYCPQESQDDLHGIEIESSTDIWVYFNSVHIHGYWDESSRAFFQDQSGTNIDIRNNIFSNDVGGYASVIESSGSSITPDYNNYYSVGNFLAHLAGDPKTDLADLQDGDPDDQHSISVNPVFDSHEDLHTTTFRLSNLGDPDTDITDLVPLDLEGETRTAGSPEMGAYEFTTTTGDALNGDINIGTGEIFETIADAVDELNKYGIDGPLTFHIMDNGSPYDDPIFLKPVSGVDMANHVTFMPADGNTGPVEIVHDGTGGYSYTFQIRRASYITVKNLTITASDPNNPVALAFNGYCSNDSILDCIINSNGIVNYAPVYSNSDLLESIYIGGNTINDGRNGIYLNGHDTYFLTDIEIIDNAINNIYEWSIYLEDAESPIIKGNTVNSRVDVYNAYYWGIYLEDCHDDYEIVGNTVINIEGEGGIRINKCDGGASNFGLIANNAVDIRSGGNSNGTGIRTTSSNYVKIYYNTVKLSGGLTSSDAEAWYNDGGSNLYVKNNIFANFGKGRVVYLRQDTPIEESDYNCLFHGTGIIFGRWDNVDYNTMKEYQANSNTEAHSMFVNPAFIDTDTLKSNSFFLDNSGIDLTEISEDIDGVTRTDPPDIGAYEFTSDITPMAGTYKIGGTTPDYEKIKTAFDDLQIRGISAPVSLEVRPGKYEERVGTIYKIPGTNANDTVVLKSETGNPEDVVISYVTVSENAVMFQMNNVDYFTIRDMTITALGTSVGHTLVIRGTSKCINIINNILVSANTQWTNLWIAECITDSILIKDNQFTKGYCSIYFDGNSSTRSTNTRIIGNSFTGASQKAIYLLRQDEPHILNNTINNVSVNDFEGIELDNCFRNLVVSGNRITSNTSETGIYITNCEAVAPFFGLISNNMVQLGGTDYAYGIHVNNSDRMYFYHNTVHLSAYRNDGNLYGFYSENNNNEIEIVNNIFHNSGSGRAMFIEDGNDITLSDYNNFYSADDDKFVRWGSTDYTNMADYQAASSMDANSLNLDPLFMSETNLYSGQAGLYQAGKELEDVPVDIDGVSRTVTDNPDIGAAEFSCGTPVFDIEVLPSCFGDSTIFIDNSTNVAGGSTYFWSFDNDWNAEITSKIKGDTIRYVFATAGEQQVKFWISQIAGCTDDTTIEVTVNPLPVLDPEITGAYCGNDDGQITINVTEGIGPFNYYWSTGDTGETVTGLALGTYTVAVSDKNNCSTTEEIVIEEKMQVTVEELQVSTCGTPTGQAEVSVTGGVEPYRYVWSNGDTAKVNTNLSTGVHYVNVIDANDCYAQGFVNIGNDGTGPQIALDSLDHNVCYGDRNGSIGITITSGTEPYLIKWSNGSAEEDLTELASGIYDVVVTDATGCIGSGSFEVTQPPRIDINAIVEDASCGGADGKAVAVVSGGEKPYIYEWSNGGVFSIREGLAAGVYSVKVTDINGCEQVEPVIVNNVNGPVPIIESVKGVSCANQNDGEIVVNVIGGTGAPTFSWDPGGQVTGTITGLTPGEYTVTVTDGVGCVGVNYAEIVQDPPEVNPICLVTVDTATGNNMVVWEKTVDQDLDYYVIYRETSLKGIYQPIGTSEEAGTFLDEVADPTIRSWRYKLSVVDECGVESDLSEHHKTMHLTINLGIDGRINLIWDHYEGFEVTTYKVWRYSAANGWENIADMPANLTSYTDMNPPEEDLTYYIEVLKDEPCSLPDLKAGTLNSSKSNRQRRLQTSVGGLFGHHNLSIFPNPGNGVFHISLDQAGSDNIDVKVYNLSGKLLYINEFIDIRSRFEGTIDLSGFAPGVYHIHVRTNNALYHRALIIE